MKARRPAARAWIGSLVVMGAAVSAQPPAAAVCTGWTAALTPSLNGSQTVLESVSADSPRDAWAAGVTRGSRGTTPVIEHWNGAKWAVSPSPKLLNEEALSVAAISPKDVWVVGQGPNTPAGQIVLAEHWNGFRWSVIPTPKLPCCFAYEFTSVSAVSSKDVWAVGSGQSGSSFVTVAEHWNGKKWSRAKTPNPGPSGATLTN
jgi:hypothetical protein